MRKAIFLAIVLLTVSSSALAMSSSDCLDCHSDKTLTKQVGGKEISLFIDEGIFSKSIHGDLDCTDCHTDLADVEGEHGEKVKPVSCANCHDDVAKKMAGSDHPAECSDCHGTHNILPPSDSRSSVYALNVPRTCCTCHSGQESPDVCVQYEKGMHGTVLIRSGMIYSAVCNDCHGSHDIRGPEDPDSKVARANINSTCGACHAGVVETYKKSVHGQLFAEDPEDAPVCTSCHSPHDTERAMDPSFHLTVVKRCSSCHPEMGYTFSRNYHGQVTGMGDTRAAQCPDCHGSHDILPPDDPASMVNPNNLVTTCGKCHPGANRNFTMYMPHADYHDAKHYPMLYYVYLAMVILLTGTFAFFGIHTLLWFIRSYLENLRTRSGGDN